MEANRHQKQVLALKVRRYFRCAAGAPARCGTAVRPLGPGVQDHTDNIREAMALELIESLTALGAEEVVHDFEAMPNVRAKLGDRRGMPPIPSPPATARTPFSSRPNGLNMARLT